MHSHFPVEPNFRPAPSSAALRSTATHTPTCTPSPMAPSAADGLTNAGLVKAKNSLAPVHTPIRHSSSPAVSRRPSRSHHRWLLEDRAAVGAPTSEADFMRTPLGGLLSLDPSGRPLLHSSTLADTAVIEATVCGGNHLAPNNPHSRSLATCSDPFISLSVEADL